MNKQKQKIIAVLLVFMMMMTILPTAPAFAADNYSYTAGAFTIISNEPLTAGLDYSCQNYSSDTHQYNYNVLTINTDKPITIKNTNSAQTHDSIVVAAGVSANITLAGVNISTYVNEYHSTYHPALQIADGSTGNVTITLADGTTNTLVGGPYKAGLQKNGDRNTGTLTIQGDTLGTGTLYAESDGFGAGIGGAYQNTASNITINKARVTAQGGLCAAGIGGGGSENGSGISGQYGKAANIKIIDSIVTATGGNQGAGIGGGIYGSLASLQISGGSVKAIAGAGAKTLGSGALSNVGYVPPTDDGTGTGHQLYLLTIANPTGESVMIDGKEYAIKQHSSDDTNLYVYLTGTEHTVYTTKTLKYTLEDKENVNAPELISSHTHVDSNDNNSCDECSATTKTIKFDKNNDTSDTVTMKNIVLDTAESSYTLPECAFTAPEGKYFKGWATEANGEVITGSKITVSGNMTLYAVWGNKYSITFNSNGGNGTMESKTVIEGTEYTLPECTFTPLKDHYFLGWAESEAEPVITDETITVNKDIELYAIWKEMLFDGEKTTLDISKGKVEIGADSLNAYASDGTNLTTPDYDGYIITGSSTSTSNTVFADRVYVEISGGSHKITLRDLSIDVSSLDYATAFMINNAQVELKLEGTNSLASGKGYAALNLEGASATLTITADSTGSLTANGGENAAGIGPTNGKTCGDITIAGGNINIVDDNDSVTADIGVGNSGNCGTISITGGKFGSGDVSANKVYGVAVAACSSVRDSGDTTYPYLVSQGNHTDTTTVVANNDGTHDVTYTCCGTVVEDNETCYGGTATCIAKAVCSVCNAEYGEVDAANHTSTVKYTNNAVGTHKKVYDCCKLDVTEACFGGTATCTTQAVCEYCSTAYGDVLGHDYAFTLTQGETTHYYDCSRCDINKDEAAHSYTNWTSNDDGTHTGTCVCGKTSTVACSYENNKCTECGYEEPAIHIHNLTAHAAVPETCCTSGTIAYWECSECNQKFSDADATTVVTDITIPAAGEHKDADWETNDVHHWHVCEVGGTEFDKAEHAYTGWTSNNDGTHTGTCVCGKTSTVDCSYENNKCTVCGYEEPVIHIHNLTAHAAVPATCCKSGTIAYWECSECNQKFSDADATIVVTDITIPAAGEHKDADWETNDVHHWHVCEVGGTEFDKAAHDYTGWTSNNDGTHTGTCVCGKTSIVDCSYGDDYICDVCNYDSTPESGGENPGEGEGGNEGGTTNPDEGEGGGDTTTPSNPSTSTGGGGFSGTYNYPVTTPTTDNGSVSLSDNNASAGETVTATVTPDKGYGVAEVIVTDEKGNIIPVTYLGNGEYSFVMPAGKVNIETVCKPAITLTIGNKTANIFGKEVVNDVAPMIRNNSTMLPIRFVAEALGANVSWNADTQTVTITKGDTVIKIIIGADYAYINGKKVKLDAPAFIKDNRTYLPVRFISEALGADVNWDAVTRQVVIMK